MSSRAFVRPELALEGFIVSNLAFLGGDIIVAHSENAFRRGEEWIPIAFSLSALILVPGLFFERVRRSMRGTAIAIGAGAIIVGVAGMLYHLDSSFFAERTLASLVYAAPFIAPLSYVGVGLLIIMSRMERPEAPAYSEWVLFLALGGFVGNFGLTLTDHAQNGFFSISEWVPVASAAFMTSFLSVAILRPGDQRFDQIVGWIIAIECAVGVLGFILHLGANIDRPGSTIFDKSIFGAPPFAPLLFVDLSMLVGIGLWARRARLAAPSRSENALSGAAP